MKVSGINVYCVKSCKGKAVQSWPLDSYGLKYDRQWVIVDNNNNFLTQRQFHKISLIETDINYEDLILRASGMPELKVPLDLDYGTISKIKVWSSSLDVIEQGRESKKWLSKFLEADCRLVRIPSSIGFQRVAEDKKTPILTPDNFPFLAISEESLTDLSKRAGKEIPMDRFRPNLVLSGLKPYGEDELKLIEIGNVILKGARQCDRCEIPNINQLTGKMEDKVPTKTLTGYRRVGKDILFGMYFAHQNLGEVSVGDEVKVLEKL